MTVSIPPVTFPGTGTSRKFTGRRLTSGLILIMSRPAAPAPGYGRQPTPPRWHGDRSGLWLRNATAGLCLLAAAAAAVSFTANGGVGYSNCPNAPPGRQSPATQTLLFLDALEESPSDHLDPPADGSCIRREDSGDLPGHTAAVRRHGTLSRLCRDLLTCGFSPG